uniref:Transcriptional repressor p66 coiled-coil MBD2-interaction domain-containing protein n=1 Tax=Globodera rostochiensis TaxID=31243 RepID=A0A914HVK0_GLORO
MLADMGDNTNGGSGVHSVGASRRNHPNGNGASSLAQAEAEANATMLLCNVCSDGHDDNERGEEGEDEKLSNTTNSDCADCKSAEKSAKKTTDHKTPPQHDENTEQPDNNTNDVVDNDNNDFSVQLSANCPSLRRSTRVSALNAKKQQSEQRSAAEQQDRDSSSCTKSRQRTDELDMVQEHSTGAGDGVVPTTTGMDVVVDGDASTLSQSPQHRVTSLKRKLKRKLDDGQELDQYDCKFGIRLDTDGDVVMMSDESDISSLNEADVAVLRERYENVRRQEVPNDVLTQRELQIRELESVLRLEEAKLFMLKKLQQSQQKAVQKMQQQQQQQQQQECVRRLAPGVVQNSSGQAYKPKVAVVNPSPHQSGNANKANGTSQHGKKGLAKADVAALQNGAGIGASLGSMTNSGAGIQLAALPPQHQQQLYTRLSQNPQQLAQMIKTLPHGTGQALTELLRQYAVAQASNMPTSGGQVQNSNAASAAKFSQHLQSSATSQAIAQAQIDAAHKQARELTQQKIVTARQQLRKELDVMFIPNGNQPDFSYLLGLDLTVQRVLKDKSMFRKVDFPPYQCEECETDFTPSWKAICGEQEDYHLYCERCIRQAQKRKVRQDYTALLKRAFQQVQDKEKEFERQVLAGKYNVEPVLPTPPSMAAPTQQQTTTTTTSTGSVHNQLKQTQQQHNVQATVSNQSSTSAALKNVSSTVAAAAALQPFNQHQQHHHQQQQQQQNASSTALNLSKSAGGGGITNTVTSVTSSAKSHHASSSQQTKSSSAKRISAGATPSSSSSSATVANPLAALAQNPQLQQQFAAMASFSSSPLFRQMLSNPMLAATMANNPMVFQHLYSALATQQQQRTQQQQQNAQNSAANASGAGAGNAMAAALIQAAAQQVHQQQNRSSTSSSTAAVSTTNSGGGAANLPSSTASSSSSSANSIAQQMAAMAAFVSNPMLALQSQLSQLGAGGGGGANNANAQLLSQLTSNPQLLRQFHQIKTERSNQTDGTTTTTTNGARRYTTTALLCLMMMLVVLLLLLFCALPTAQQKVSLLSWTSSHRLLPPSRIPCPKTFTTYSSSCHRSICDATCGSAEFETHTHTHSPNFLVTHRLLSLFVCFCFVGCHHSIPSPQHLNTFITTTMSMQLWHFCVGSLGGGMGTRRPVPPSLFPPPPP